MFELRENEHAGMLEATIVKRTRTDVASGRWSIQREHLGSRGKILHARETHVASVVNDTF
jgi:hypothetical protein